MVSLGHHETHSYAAGSPTTDGQYLYASFGSFGTYCYDFDGNLKWSRDLGPLHTRRGWGEAVTPVIAGDSLLEDDTLAGAQNPPQQAAPKLVLPVDVPTAPTSDAPPAQPTATVDAVPAPWRIRDIGRHTLE